MKSKTDHPAGCGSSLLGIDLAGSADDPLASRARALLAARVTSVLVGAMMLGLGIALLAADWADLLGAALIGTGLMRFIVTFAVGRRSGIAFLLHNLTGALLVGLGLVEIGNAAGLEAWGILVVVIPPLLMGPEDGRARRVIYGIGIAIVAAAEIASRLLPPRQILPPDVLADWRIVNFAGAALVLTVLIWVYRKALDNAEARVAEQQKVSDELLANILPEPIAERLKRNEYPIADAHTDVTIMFADGVNFSGFAANNRPETVVDLLNHIVGAFDDMAQRCGVEKIKTIGDAYMAAGGLTEKRGDDAAAVAELAFEMLHFVHEFGHRAGMQIDLRIGIHTGPLVAGVIGKHKFSYDVWGDTVNIAAHLESAGEPGRVHISEATARALGPGWQVEPRGPIAVKGHASIPAFYLLGRAAATIAAQ